MPGAPAIYGTTPGTLNTGNLSLATGSTFSVIASNPPTAARGPGRCPG